MTERFIKRAGDPVLTSDEDPAMTLMGDTTPDDVRLPPNLGGNIVRVERSFRDPCPVCQSQHVVKHLALVGGIHVAECGARGFLWYRKR